MVTIVDYKEYQKEDGTNFCALVVQAGLQAIKSKETGRTYFTAKKAQVACTFNAELCQSLIGNEIDGTIKRREVEPYEYTNPETGEIMTLSHRYEYIGAEEETLDNHLVSETVVA